jgi:hypothetical protein
VRVASDPLKSGAIAKCGPSRSIKRHALRFLFVRVKCVLTRWRQHRQKNQRDMTRYRMRVYAPCDPEPRLWQTHDIFATDDDAAKKLAQERYDELSRELAQQQRPKMDDPTLVNFSLYDGERLVVETVRKDRQ